MEGIFIKYISFHNLHQLRNKFHRTFFYSTSLKYDVISLCVDLSKSNVDGKYLIHYKSVNCNSRSICYSCTMGYNNIAPSILIQLSYFHYSIIRKNYEF